MKDSWDKKKLATSKLHCVMTIREGKIAFDEDGLAFPVWTGAGKYEVLP